MKFFNSARRGFKHLNDSRFDLKNFDSVSESCCNNDIQSVPRDAGGEISVLPDSRRHAGSIFVRTGSRQITFQFHSATRKCKRDREKMNIGHVCQQEVSRQEEEGSAPARNLASSGSN
ncbi:hypothetical protein F2P81_025540 [Scophthalmus maximus]|uniref:Uncharacterized protein n=1 Tax=Scophthalmus maximus TaxID=52904 RepID=A0A6A4RPT2_SCOMX|nr:hypothetical protein F2P81_025540 [Scophthalmus maximus]